MKASWFTDRVEPLRQLTMNLRALADGEGDNIAIMGQRKIGKTEVLKKFVNEAEGFSGVVVCYVNFQAIISSIEVFATRYIGKILHKALQVSGKNFPEELGWTDLKLMAAEAGSNISGYVNNFLSIVEEGDGRRLLQIFEMAINFPQFLAIDRNLRFMMVIDEFHEVKNLTTFKELKHIDRILHSLFLGHSEVRYLVSASQIDMATAFLNSPRSPLFTFFKVRDLSPFSRQDTYDLVQKIFKSSNGVRFQPEVLPRIYRLSLGQPFTITAICREAVNIGIYTGQPIDSAMVDKAFSLELLSSEGRIFLLCDYILHFALSSVKGGNTLRSIILILSERDGLLLKDIAKAMSRPPGQVRGYLLLLLKTDVICRRGNRYYFTNPLLRFWVALREKYFRYSYGIDDSIVSDLVAEYEREYLLPSPGGFPARAAVAMTLEEKAPLQGLEIFLDEQIEFPAMGGYSSFVEMDHTGMITGIPGIIELDFIAPLIDRQPVINRETGIASTPLMACEIHDGDLPATEKDVLILLRKIDFLNRSGLGHAQFIWFVSIRGFTASAIEMARSRNIHMSAQPFLENSGLGDFL
ncbi:MAG: hypothetical protein CVV64_09495 [Candidatus Wallbacteria bacterium HGW-Wallbacteria-1]|jgi:AAA+ ATPase superfamily predicted ATPase|uniref:ATPase domain-containing protein n=1 Tax=Candidatus Wallbacteria bacterium HGW-Wallbacteria-1 TaxID=2013854 RepID=A0A2N1PQG1_9BACT|nr:MAG: hypothetical protein CVV64_09495 [Candidatus Wallbacteria bacterium HGW-Wallbacteria-1]